MKSQLHNNPTRTTPVGLIRYAVNFHEAALAVDDRLGTKPGYEIIAPIPALYLIGHSIELSLKALLLYKGISLGDIRDYKKYGHNLAKCFKKSVDMGLSIEFDEHELDAFHVLNELYSTKQLEYIVTGSKRFPIFGHIETFSVKLLTFIGPMVGYKCSLEDIYP